MTLPSASLLIPVLSHQRFLNKQTPHQSSTFHIKASFRSVPLSFQLQPSKSSMKGMMQKAFVIAVFLQLAIAQSPLDDPDQDTIQKLMQNRAQISRDVEQTEAGVLTHTYSSNPEVAGWIQKHVAEMKARVEENRVIRAGDPLFVAVFDNAADLDFQYTDVADGVRVTETGKTECAVDLVHAHAQVVSSFIQNGPTE
eukprot:1861812-Rhodomonas_salina.1